VLIASLAVVVALAQERRALAHALALPREEWIGEFRVTRGTLAGRPLHLIQAGIGAARAGRATRELLDRLPCDEVWSLGFAGGLVAGLWRGDLVCADRLLCEATEGCAVRTGAAAETVVLALRAAGLRAHAGPILTVGAPLRTAAAKRAAHERTGALAVEMEAFGVAEVAAARGLRWTALKVILDGVEDPLPEATARCTTPRGDLSIRGLAEALLGGGGTLAALWRLGRAVREARRTLRGGLQAAAAARSP
jgi:nucleoside phosphorylase